MSRTQRWTWSASVLVTAAVVGALFLPLYDCALCGLYKASRSERGGCWCNERSKVNLLEWRSLRNQVRRELLEEECGGRAIYRTRRAGI